MIRHVIFDLDGTLVDSCGACIDILAAMRAERGHGDAIDHDRARGYMSAGGEAMVSALLGDARADAASDLAEFRSRYAGYRTDRAALFPLVAQGLAALASAGLVLSICSNKPENLCHAVLRDTGIAAHFRVVVGGRSQLAAKPSPEPLRTAIAALGAGPQECLFVGDSEIDHEAACAAGVPFLFMTYGYAAPGWSPLGGASYACFGAMSAALVGRARAGREHLHA